MRQPTRVAPTPLFDRLVSVESLTNPSTQLSALDMDGLKSSIARELERLLVSRSRRTRADMPKSRTTVDYGVADHFMFDPRSEDDRKQLGEELEDTIMAYEPRLEKVRVRVEDPTEVETRLRIRIDSVLCAGGAKEPLGFNVVRRGEFLEVKL